MRKVWTLAMLLCICAIFSAESDAQMMASNISPEMPIVPVVEAPVPVETVHTTHKFFDRQNIALSMMTFSAALADGITTQHALGIHRTATSIQNGLITTTNVGYVERNPIAAPLVNRGWAGQMAATALTAGADLGIRNWLHRKGHHRMERVVPFMFAATSASFAAHNAHYW